MAILCDQGCKAHVYWSGNKLYNVLDGKLHEQTCMNLKIGKWWGGYYNTISIDRIKASIQRCYDQAKEGDRTTAKQISVILNVIQSELVFVLTQIRDQERWNERQKKEFGEYKTRLVAEQTLREERKKSRRQYQQPRQEVVEDE